MLTQETIKRKVDETNCDWCGAPIEVGQRVHYDLAEGAAYCSRSCGAMELRDAEFDTPGTGAA